MILSRNGSAKYDVSKKCATGVALVEDDWATPELLGFPAVPRQHGA